MAGCASLKDPEASQEYHADVVGSVAPGQTVGQTFLSRRPGLDGIQLWMRLGSESASTGLLTAEIYHAPGDTQPLVVTFLTFQSISQNSPVSLSFPALAGSPGQSYYLVLKSEDGQVDVLGRNEDMYPAGQALIGEKQVDADLGFRTSYSYNPAAILADLRLWSGRLWLAIPLALVLWLPGRVLLGLAGMKKRLDWGERSAISVGLSLALIPLLMTWTTTLGLHWSPAGVWGGALFFAAIYLWQSQSSIKQLVASLGRQPGSRKAATSIADDPPPQPDAAHQISNLPASKSAIPFLLAGVFLFSLAVRLAMVRDMAAPAWVDSVHHAMIAHLVVEQGAFPENYAPFLEIDTASYHPGFHSAVAVFHWLSGLEIADAMLLFGQVLNALAVLSVYLFTTTFTRDRTAGLVAGLITGVLTPMPAYYTSWGRYTQLAGLLILPAAMALLIPAMDFKPLRLRNFLEVKRLGGPLWLAAIVCAGLFLTHYRVIVFLACLLVAYFVALAAQSFQKRVFKQEVPGWIGRVSLAAVIAILLTLPWWPTTLRTLFVPTLEMVSRVQTPIKPFNDFSWSFLTTASGNLSIVFASYGLLLGILQKRQFALILPLWAGLLFLLANLGALRLPGAGFVNNTSVEITMFMPLSALGGTFISWFISFPGIFLPHRWHTYHRWGVGLAGVVLALGGARTLMPILNPITMLFHQADRPAMIWIRENIPPDETILINPFSWGYGLYAGNDGGFWITPMAGRKSMPPPVLYGLGDMGPEGQQISETARLAIEKSKDPAELHAFLQSQGIHYVYIGARGGALSPHLLRSSPLFVELYAQKGTYIFQVY